jgi:prepilin signal peptidase PulO-like enzyme (type II secretory pathway)
VSDGRLKWEGRRYPSWIPTIALFAFVIFLVATSIIAWKYYNAPVRFEFVILLGIGFVLFLFVFGTSFVDISVQLENDVLIVELKETMARRTIRQKPQRIERERIAKIVERRVGWLDIVILEDSEGLELSRFARFLESEEHDNMISVLMEWGNQPSFRASSGSVEVPLADSR